MIFKFIKDKQNEKVYIRFFSGQSEESLICCGAFVMPKDEYDIFFQTLQWGIHKHKVILRETLA